jgi:hypothetical protein
MSADYFEAFVGPVSCDNDVVLRKELGSCFWRSDPSGRLLRHVGWLHDHLHLRKRKEEFSTIEERRNGTDVLEISLGIYH